MGMLLAVLLVAFLVMLGFASHLYTELEKSEAEAGWLEDKLDELQTEYAMLVLAKRALESSLSAANEGWACAVSREKVYLAEAERLEAELEEAKQAVQSLSAGRYSLQVVK